MNEKEQDMQEIDIAAYIDGGLAVKEREALLQRLMSDGGERDALALVESVVQDAGAGGGAPERLERKARELYPRGPGLVDLIVSLADKAIKVLAASPGTDIMTPVQMGMVRNRASSAEPLVVAFRSFQQARIYVHVENMGGNLCQFTVQAREPSRDVPLENARADLVSAAWRELGSNPFVSGMTQFEDISPGQYDLIVRKNDSIIGKMTIQIAGR